jgi:hypothetical protein
MVIQRPTKLVKVKVDILPVVAMIIIIIAWSEGIIALAREDIEGQALRYGGGSLRRRLTQLPH